jgi:hypothetical protein
MIMDYFTRSHNIMPSDEFSCPPMPIDLFTALTAPILPPAGRLPSLSDLLPLSGVERLALRG